MMNLSKLTARSVLSKELVNINLLGLSNPLDARIANAIELSQDSNWHISTLDSLDALKLEFKIILTSLPL